MTSFLSPRNIGMTCFFLSPETYHVTTIDDLILDPRYVCFILVMWISIPVSHPSVLESHKLAMCQQLTDKSW